MDDEHAELPPDPLAAMREQAVQYNVDEAAAEQARPLSWRLKVAALSWLWNLFLTAVIVVGFASRTTIAIALIVGGVWLALWTALIAVAVFAYKPARVRAAARMATSGTDQKGRPWNGGIP